MFNALGMYFERKNSKSISALEVHSIQLTRWLEELWRSGPQKIEVEPKEAGRGYLGSDSVVENYGLPQGVVNIFPSGIDPKDPKIFTGIGLAVEPCIWHHLIYAYLLEQTGVVEIFTEVLRRAAGGEVLSVQDEKAVRWLKTTEELFFKDPPPFSIIGVTSQLRPELRVVRRNAYWRMFGLDLAHPLPGRPNTNGSGPHEWKQFTGNGVNTTFREKWSELLRQIWLGVENRNNKVGANATDDAYLLLLCESLRDMLNMRRRGGALAREEFAAVALLSWFDLTLSDNSPIVCALNAQATSPADRLALIAQQVGMTPAPRSRELFDLAPLMSLTLRCIEANFFNSASIVQLLYAPNTKSFEVANRVIDLWQSATGERVKDRPAGVVMSPTSAQPLRVPGSQPLATGTRPSAVNR